MGAHHSHSHDHGHHHHGSKNKKALKLSFIIIATYMIVEVIGGILTNSLALLSDAGHMLSDAVALGLSYLALTFGEKQATLSKTFGYKRFEILAAFINGVTLIGISVYIFWEAYKRIQSPPEVISGGMLIISVLGLLVNIIAAYILMSGDKDENLNVRSAFLHVLGDLLGSVGAITAALLIMVFGWNLADPIASVIVAVLIIISGYRVTKDSFHILMEGAPSNINVKEIKESLLQITGVRDVHDLHVWSITSEFPALSCHIVIDVDVNQQDILKTAQTLLHHNYHLEHTTIQIDLIGENCEGDLCN
ncbi:cation diffusion facilitator family transporter [Sutcliffiella horikoshii]|uniref:cation diffusion facilitator family transporter n=1 Tax=Sutcliffiella TaxID=2837511 RepID=UPI001CC062C1|nr:MULTISPECIES: cation diffusion facilitator family transporter [Bacillaceae]MCA1322165.1 cation diffusion facilitator family transporter [Bacillus tianshenii]MCM3619668.1 cation diffusion facilitator family transporter [Sutcliffiella horikoshii]MED4016593.1 cation diffusion facilitator family transporter [Sutcliffiella cohnii]UAL49845.1 cation diffusion facilitator family transporter [Sutcliffiella horikoshii]